MLLPASASLAPANLLVVTYSSVALRDNDNLEVDVGTLDINRLNMAQLSPADFARLVKDMREAELAELMAGDQRGQVLDEIFGRMQEQLLPEKGPRRRSVVHWHVTGRPDGGYDAYELVMADGTCAVTAPPKEAPRLTITLDAVEFLQLVSGNASSTMMFFSGRLSLDGDLALGAGLIGMFDIPKP